jgi:hypothetical protein
LKLKKDKTGFQIPHKNPTWPTAPQELVSDAQEPAFYVADKWDPYDSEKDTPIVFRFTQRL